MERGGGLLPNFFFFFLGDKHGDGKKTKIILIRDRHTHVGRQMVYHTSILAKVFSGD